jgi:hypothetical protein
VPAVLGKECTLSIPSPPHETPYRRPHPVYEPILSLKAFLSRTGIIRPDVCPQACACDEHEPSMCREEPAEVFACPGRIVVGVTPTFMKRAHARAEFATTASHLKAIKAVYDSGASWALVLEDDASLMLVPEWRHFGLQEVLSAVPRNWGVVQLYTWLGGSPWTMERMRSEILAGRLVSKRHQTGADYHSWGAAAYAVSRRGAKRLLDTYWPGVTSAMTMSSGGGGDSLATTEAVQMMDLRLNPVSELMVFSGPQTFMANRPLFGHQLYPISGAYRAFSAKDSSNHGDGIGSDARTSTIHANHLSTHDRGRQRLLRVFYSLGQSFYLDPKWYAMWPRWLVWLVGFAYDFDWDSRVALAGRDYFRYAESPTSKGLPMASNDISEVRWVWPGPGPLRDGAALTRWIGVALEDFDLYRSRGILRNLLATTIFGVLLPLGIVAHAKVSILKRRVRLACRRGHGVKYRDRAV